MQLSIRSVLGNSQRLDGGSMYGNCPRAVWSRWSPPDEQDRIALACRAMLVRSDDRNILFETGIGAFFAPDLRARYSVVEPHHVLLESLRSVGLEDSDIDVVVLVSSLHIHDVTASGLSSSSSDYIFDGSSATLPKLFGVCGFAVGDLVADASSDGINEELVLTTLNGDLVVYELKLAGNAVALGGVLHWDVYDGALGANNAILIHEIRLASTLRCSSRARWVCGSSCCSSWSRILT